MDQSGFVDFTHLPLTDNNNTLDVISQTLKEIEIMHLFQTCALPSI